jgi:hypothetical protein
MQNIVGAGPPSGKQGPRNFYRLPPPLSQALTMLGLERKTAVEHAQLHVMESPIRIPTQLGNAFRNICSLPNVQMVILH